jgi:TonB family protein
MSVQVREMTELWKQWEGEVINGEFHLREYLGGTDHSAVFLTERGQHNQQKAAIKLIPDDPYNTKRQLSRWAAAAELSHPHLLRLFQMGRCQFGDRRLLYLVMEYAQENLVQVLPQRALTPPELEDMLPPLVEALTFLHGKSFVHGQLKPSNIMAVNDRLKLSSDGLRAAGEPSGVPRKHSAYDPPEMLDGSVLQAGDVWSLGVTLVEALTQRFPEWAGGKQDSPALPETMPSQYTDIARHCLRREPSLRWTIDQIAAHIKPESMVVAEPVVDKPPKSVNWRHVAPIGAVILAALAVVGLKLGSRRAESSPTSSSAPAPPQNKPTPPPVQTVPKVAQTEPPPVSHGPALTRTTNAVVKGAVLEQVLPDVPKSASDTITGTVRVRVKVAVDAAGNVSDATLDSAGPSKYFANLALRAARRWKFKPAQKNDQDIPSEWMLNFGFKNTSNTVSPRELAP